MFNFFQEIKKAAQFVDDFHIINISGKILYVEGCQGLVLLSTENIIFKVSGQQISVTGKDLTLAELTENTLKICGQIYKQEVYK